MDVKTLAQVNRTQVENFCRAQAKVVQVGANPLAAVRVLGKYNLVVDTADLSVAMPIALDGYWEMWITRFLISEVREGWNAIDVGASWGYYTLLFADLVGDSGRVESWEANASTHRVLERLTLPLNGELATRITTRLDAAWSTGESCLELFIPSEQNLGGATVLGALDGPDVRLFRVTARRLDETSLERVDFVKIDAEGAEEEIWKGMTGLFARGEPKAMFIEFTPSVYRDPMGFLNAMGLEGFRVSEISDESKLVRIDPHDLVARKGWVPLWLRRDSA